MRPRALFGVVFTFVLVMGVGVVRAEGDEPGEEHGAPAEHHEAAAPEEHHDQTAPAEHHEAEAAEHHEAEAEAAEHHDADAEHDSDEAASPDADDDDEEVDANGKKIPFDEFDVDGDGKPDVELKKEYQEAFAGVPEKIDTEEVDAELEARPHDKQMLPSITVEQFRKAVGMARTVVLDRMEKKMARKAAQRLHDFAWAFFFISLAGFLLLFMPLFLAKKHPGKMGTLFKYSALAAVTFFVTVNLFGGVLIALRTTQTALGAATNPQLAVAAGTFDTLDRNAEEYIDMGKELFVPTLEQLRGNNDEQPSVLLLQNGQKVIKDAKVFVGVAKMFKKMSFVFSIIPILLFFLSLVLFALAIRPTLTEIIKLPIRAAQGEAGVGREVTKKAMMRVWGELRASVCTILVLAMLTMLTGFVLARVVAPALDALLGYFSRAVTYLQFADNASSGLVFVTLFAVILFLALNVGFLVLSSAFFLGKTQKIFQAKFNEGTPLAKHGRFFKIGVPALLLVQLFPVLYAFIADKVLLAIDHSLLDGVSDANQVSWGKLLLAGPAFLVVGFLLLFWAVRGFKAIGFLFGYKVKPKPPVAPASEDAHPV